MSMLLAVVLAFALPPQDAPQQHPIAAQVRAALADPAKPFTLVVVLKVKDGGGAKFEAAVAKATRETRKEKGNRAYDLHRAPKGTTDYILYERWQDLAALEGHLKAPHFTTLLAEIGDLLDGPPDLKIFVPVGE